MGTREKVLMLFEKNKGRYISGEEIAGSLDVSRTSVWKAVNRLRSEGYIIDSVTNKGYCLSEETDILSAQGIYKYLDDMCVLPGIEVLPVTGSTNTYLSIKAGEGAEDGYTVVANGQTCGRGRAGKTFFSPDGTGIYMSILLRPEMCSADHALRITTMAAVAMCEAIEEVSDKRPEIKWVNDIFINDRKVCGILTEASFSLEGGFLDYAVLGLGINVYRPENGFPDDIKDTAGSIYEDSRKDLKNRLAAAFLNDFMRYYRNDSMDYTAKYRSYSLLINKKVVIIKGDRRENAEVYDINDDCRLCVRYEDGSTEELGYGEVQIVNQ